MAILLELELLLLLLLLENTGGFFLRRAAAFGPVFVFSGEFFFLLKRNVWRKKNVWQKKIMVNKLFQPIGS